MAAIPVTLKGVVTQGMGPAGPYDVGQEITFTGLMSYTGLGIGGGPIIPPPGSGGPPGTPEHPIVPPGGYPHPEHPIAGPPPGGITPPDPILPPDLPDPVPPNSVIKQAPEGGWGLNSDANGGIYWVYNPAVSPKK